MKKCRKCGHTWEPYTCSHCHKGTWKEIGAREERIGWYDSGEAKMGWVSTYQCNWCGRRTETGMYPDYNPLEYETIGSRCPRMRLYELIRAKEGCSVNYTPQPLMI